jgi:hypothetical protein
MYQIENPNEMQHEKKPRSASAIKFPALYQLISRLFLLSKRKWRQLAAKIADIRPQAPALAFW